MSLVQPAALHELPDDEVVLRPQRRRAGWQDRATAAVLRTASYIAAADALQIDETALGLSASVAPKGAAQPGEARALARAARAQLAPSSSTVGSSSSIVVG